MLINETNIYMDNQRGQFPAVIVFNFAWITFVLGQHLTTKKNRCTKWWHVEISSHETSSALINWFFSAVNSEIIINFESHVESTKLKEFSQRKHTNAINACNQPHSLIAVSCVTCMKFFFNRFSIINDENPSRVSCVRDTTIVSCLACVWLKEWTIRIPFH